MLTNELSELGEMSLFTKDLTSLVRFGELAVEMRGDGSVEDSERSRYKMRLSESTFEQEEVEEAKEEDVQKIVRVVFRGGIKDSGEVEFNLNDVEMIPILYKNSYQYKPSNDACCQRLTCSQKSISRSMY